jgi:hypothetical protein
VPPGQEPESAPHIYDDLNDHPRGKERDRAIELYYQLLSSGRPLSEIIASGIEQLRDPGDTAIGGHTDGTLAGEVDGPRVPPIQSAVAVPPTDSNPPIQSIPELLLGRVALSAGDHLNAAAGPDSSAEHTQIETLRRSPTKNLAFKLKLDATARTIRLVLIALVCGGLIGVTAVGGVSFLRRASQPPVLQIDAGGSGAIRSDKPAALVAADKTTAKGGASEPHDQIVDPGATANQNTAAPSSNLEAVSVGLPQQATSPASTQSASAPVPQIHTPTNAQSSEDVSARGIDRSPKTYDDRRLSKDEIEALRSRGDALFGTGDVTSARLFYEYGADAGDGTAALRLAETFDPSFLQRANLNYVRSDPHRASYWYSRAHELGNSDAKLLLNDNSSLER